MNKRKKVIIFLGVILLTLSALLFYFIKIKQSEKDYPTVNQNEEKLKEILKNSGYFTESKFSYNSEIDKMTIDNTYEIYVKNGYYLMNIKNPQENSVYCNVVDAVEQSLGLEKGASNLTCEKTLDGQIELDYITSEVYETYKVLNVYYTSPSTLYNPENTREKEELISIDEINYTINLDDYMLTSFTTKYDEQSKTLQVCAHIYNENNKPAIFEISTYDENNKLISKGELNYENESLKFLNTCTTLSNELGITKYFSIKKTNSGSSLSGGE